MTLPISIQLKTDSEQQTLDLGSALARHLHAGDLVTLEGPLGSGKTCFVRGLASGLGLNPNAVSSPTYVIVQEYAVPQSKPAVPNPQSKIEKRKSPFVLIHIDAYRLHGPDDLEAIGWSDILESQDTIIAIEWPSRITDALNSKPNERVGRRIDIAFAHTGEHSRDIAINIPESARDLAAVIRNLSSRFDNQLTTDAEQPANRQSSRQESSAGLATIEGRQSILCRTCAKPIAPDDSSLPFCSKRCRLADLGKWFTESYRVSRPAEFQDDDSENV